MTPTRRLQTLGIASMWLALALAGTLPPGAHADAPAFDRPGIGFASAVLPVGTFDWEQGLPDLQTDRDGGLRSTTWSADGLLRIGFAPTLELQLSGAPWNRATLSGNGLHSHTQGAGDTAIGLKWVPQATDKHWSFALLGMVSFATGSADFSNGHQVISLGAAATRDLGDNRSLELYANADHGAGRNRLTTSVNYGFPIHGALGGYVEAAHLAGDGPTSTLAGAGLTWVIHDRVQLDLYADRGLTRRSVDCLGGFGVSVFFGR